MKINEFDQSHAVADRHEDQLLLFYDRIYPNISAVNHIRDRQRQLAGCDVELVLADGRVVIVDEKVRDRDAWQDIALEEYSNVESRRLGWLSEGKETDFLCYAVVQLDLIYWIPWKPLHLTFWKWKAIWEDQYGARYPKNRGYTSKIIPVPPFEIHQKICSDHPQIAERWPYEGEGGMLHRWHFRKEDQ